MLKLSFRTCRVARSRNALSGISRMSFPCSISSSSLLRPTNEFIPILLMLLNPRLMLRECLGKPGGMESRERKVQWSSEGLKQEQGLGQGCPAGTIVTNTSSRPSRPKGTFTHCLIFTKNTISHTGFLTRNGSIRCFGCAFHSYVIFPQQNIGIQN